MDGNPHKQKEILLQKEIECKELVDLHPRTHNGLLCPQVWDGALCWPPTIANTVARLPCPDYVNGFNHSAEATRICHQNGEWYFSEDVNSSWTNYTSCKLSVDVYNGTLIQTFVPAIKIISSIGYSISFITLIVAFFIFAVIKKLRCPRNNLHMHLFASFILRAFIVLLKGSPFMDDFAAAHTIVVDEQLQYLSHHTAWQCKTVTSLFHYFLMANYCWILMEGLYLHNLIFLALFSENNGICFYVCLGWGLPLLFMIPWTAIKAVIEDHSCWITNPNTYIFWIIRGPITLSIVINFVFFVNVTRILFLKLTSSQIADSRKYRYRKLAKSTLVLVPLFGVHYMAFMAMSFSAGVDELTEVIWLLCDQFFSSFQGFCVSVLYCFMNGEVQLELRRKWQHWYEDHTQVSANGRSSIITQSLSYFSRTRNSTTSVGDRKDGGHTQSSQNPNYTNRSSTPSPRMGRLGESSNWSYCPTMSEHNLTSLCDKSPVVEDRKFIPGNNLSPDIFTPIVNGMNLKVPQEPKNVPEANEQPQPAENLGLLYMERMEQEDESAV